MVAAELSVQRPICSSFHRSPFHPRIYHIDSADSDDNESEAAETPTEVAEQMQEAYRNKMCVCMCLPPAIGLCLHACCKRDHSVLNLRPDTTR